MAETNTTTEQPKWARITENILAVHLPVVVSVVGIIGNLIILTVLRTYKRRSSATFLLKTLAIMDLCLLAFYLLTEWYIGLFGRLLISPSPHEVYILFGCFYVVAVKRYFEFQTTWIVVIVTMDRFLHIRNPLDHLHHHPLRRSHIAVATILMVGLPLTAVKYYFFRYRIIYDENGLPTGVEQITHQRDLILAVDAVLFCLLPLFIIIPFNMTSVLVLRAKFRQHASGCLGPSSSMSVLDKSTRMTIIVVITFVVLKLPMALHILTTVILPGKFELSMPGRWSWLVARNLTVLNSAVNIFVYFLVGREFRRQFTLLIMVCRTRTTYHRSSKRERVGVSFVSTSGFYSGSETEMSGCTGVYVHVSDSLLSNNMDHKTQALRDITVV